jgi:hypothetical protein
MVPGYKTKKYIRWAVKDPQRVRKELVKLKEKWVATQTDEGDCPKGYDRDHGLLSKILQVHKSIIDGTAMQHELADPIRNEMSRKGGK